MYKFRIRAFNGFGPSEYTYKTFSTFTGTQPSLSTFSTAPRSSMLSLSLSVSLSRATDSPLTPKVIRLTPDSVTLRW